MTASPSRKNPGGARHVTHGEYIAAKLNAKAGAHLG
jgi:hypothetical protein